VTLLDNKHKIIMRAERIKKTYEGRGLFKHMASCILKRYMITSNVDTLTTYNSRTAPSEVQRIQEGTCSLVAVRVCLYNFTCQDSFRIATHWKTHTNKHIIVRINFFLLINMYVIPHTIGN
jgi:hypothetical protein